MKARSVIIIIATLLLGFVMGMLTSAQIRYHKLKPVRLFFSEDRFREAIYNTINPDENQKEKLEVVIKKYARLSRDIQLNYRKELEDFSSDLWKEMQPLLTPEQRDKFEEMERRRQDFSKQWRGRPPGDSVRKGDDQHRRMKSPGDSLQLQQHRDSLRMKTSDKSSYSRGG